LLTTGLAAMLWTFAATVIPPGAQSILAAPAGRTMSLSGVTDAGEAAADSQLIRTTLRKAWPGVGFSMESAVWAEPLQLSQSTSTASQPIGGGNNGPSATIVSSQLQVASLGGLSSQATLTAGHWPGAPSHSGPQPAVLPVALPASVASQLHLRVGSVLTGSSQSSSARVTLRVTGLFRPADPSSPYWGLDLVPVSGSSVQNGRVQNLGSPAATSTVTYGPAVVNPAAFGGALTVAEASWQVLPQAPGLANGNFAALAANTSAAVAQLSVVLPEGLQVTSSLPRALTGIASTVVLARSLFTIGALQLLLVAGAELVLAARLLASLREEESALLRARGATRWQVARPALAEAVVLGAVAGVAGVLAGTKLTGVLARLGGLRLAAHSGTIPLAWLSALVVLVLSAAVLTWPAQRAQSPDAARRPRGRQARLAGIAWAGGDLALVALAAVAVWELRGYSAVAHQAGSLGIDPVVAVAPALALAGITLIPLRGLPLVARLADLATEHERRLAAAMVSWQIARRPIRQAGPVLLVVIATATTTLGLAGYASWRQSAADQAAFAVGADAQVNAVGPLTPDSLGAITRAPGVTAATAASPAAIGNGGQLIALDASTAGQAILLRSDLSALPVSKLWQRITPSHPSGLALPGEPARLDILASLAVSSRGSTAAQRGGLGAATVMAWIQGAGGATYPIPAAAALPFDGRARSLVFSLSGLNQPGTQLRLLGFSLTYVLPPYEPAKPASVPLATLSVQSLAVAATASGPFGAPFSGGSVLAAFEDMTTSPFVPTGPAGPYGGSPPSDGIPPAVQTAGSATGSALRFTFGTGHAPSAPVMAAELLSPSSIIGTVALTAQSPSATIPAIATAGYLSANRLSVGSTVPVLLDKFPVPVTVTFQIVASVSRFPTIFGNNRALITDLAQVNDVLVAANGLPLPVTRWWLRTAGGGTPRAPAGLGLSVTGRASRQAALLGNPLLKAPRQAMLAIGLAAVLLGMLGFSISVAASLRSRRRQSAVFAALGVGKRAQAGQLCLEQLALSVPAALAGLLAGIGLAELIVPAITLTTDAALPVPSALAIVPLGPAVALAFVTAAVPVAAAALTVLRRPDPATQLRGEAG
jgi:ABC-type antimicrobial peptide transport system permease subunit